MAVQVLLDVYISVNSVVLSDHGNQVTITDTRAELDATAFGASNKIVAKGIGDGTISMQLFQDFAAGKTHATLQPLLSSSTAVPVEIRPTSAARSATNPATLMQGLLLNYNFLQGQVGELSTITAEFRNGSQTGITYPTS